MNAILSVAQLLDLTELNKEQQNLIGILKSNGNKLLTLIDDILDLSKIEAKELKLNDREFTLEFLVDNLTNSFLPQARERDLKLNIDLDPNLPTWFRGDDFRLQQVLGNLVSNALKFTSQGKIEVVIAPESPITTAKSSIVLCFSVTDTGIGIPSEQQSSLFQPFTQADSSTTRQYGGTGLGLTISRRIVELMGGTIGVNSVVGEGSTFWFTLPLEVIPEIEATPKLESGATNLTAAIDKSSETVKILVVEDYPDNRELILLMLDSFDYEIDSVNNGREALDKLAEKNYDLILMDCQMPVIDGYQATQKIREREGSQRHTTIIGLTANAMLSDRQKCLDVGMDDYLSKPIDFDKLVQIIQKWS